MSRQLSSMVSINGQAPPPYEAVASNSDGAASNSEHDDTPSIPPPAFSTFVAPRQSSQSTQSSQPAQPAQPAQSAQPPPQASQDAYDYGIPVTDNSYPDEKAMLKKKEAMGEQPYGSHFCSTTTGPHLNQNHTHPQSLPFHPASGSNGSSASSSFGGRFRNSMSNLRSPPGHPGVSQHQLQQ